MGLFSNYRGNIRFWLKVYLFIGVAVLILAVLLYTNRVIHRVEERSQATTRLFSRFIAEVVLEADDPGKMNILKEVLSEIKLPIIITDSEGRPFVWHRVGIPEAADEEFEMLFTIDPANPPPGDIAKLVELSKKFDDANDPIPVRFESSTDVQAYVHFGPSRLENELRLIPFIQLALFLVFMALALQGFRYLKLSEQRSIWVGMAKETAHQLGTPLSALLGWSQLLKDQLSEGRTEELSGSIGEMEEDLKRLSKVTERFSKIGSRPELGNVSIAEVLERTVKYFHRRLPSLKADSTLSLDLDETPLVRGNAELLEWVFENLIKNGLDALGETGGRIEIRSQFDSSRNAVEVYVKDSGKGVPAPHREQIFRPGFTTKQRGWGLGLALTRRIVEEYHGGEIKLADSHPGRGSTFLVRFPAA
ncbi:MAG: HAMP domain-containing histidine kinase [Candidatus Latescibacterota bacterium]|nr:MAG: HAMP domain-containing histidine kinase [Candidatus Latescibacterota bacterium]